MTSQSSLLQSPIYSRYSRNPTPLSSPTSLYKSLEDINNSLTELDNFLTLTEDIMKREQDLDKDLYRREREGRVERGEKSWIVKSPSVRSTMMGAPLPGAIEEVIEMDSELRKLSPSHSISLFSMSRPSSQNSSASTSFLQHHIHSLINRFTDRTKRMRTRLEIPPTPSSSCSLASPSHRKSPAEDIEEEPKAVPKPTAVAEAPVTIKKSRAKVFCWSLVNGTLDPQGRFYISWLLVVTCAFLYNAWVIPLRTSFPFQTPANTRAWMTWDYCADIIYLVDLLLIKHRQIFLYDGFWVTDQKLTRKHYMSKLQFKMDALALLPLDLLYLKLGTDAVWLRAPRLLKLQSFWKFFELIDRMMSSPHMLRIMKTLTYMLYMIHLTACTYYSYSVYEGIGSNRWVYSGKGHPYARCFAFATKTATSIGKNPKPENESELLFMTTAWLMGVFVFALLIGQIRDIIATATRSQTEYKQLVDGTLDYMRNLNLPSDMQDRIKQWFTFTWQQQHSLDETRILNALPLNLKTDIAMRVHIHTLSKVQLFSDCDEALLRDLVLKLRSVTLLPGDCVCRKGEVGKEMYIIKSGQVQVMGGLHNDQVLATLHESSVFGEISLLAINGSQGNRRTADVRARGFVNLFVLSKADLNEAIVHYPDAQAALKKRARSLMRKNAEREKEENEKADDVVIDNPKTPHQEPKLLTAVIQALPTKSAAAKLLTQGSKKRRKRAPPNHGDQSNPVQFSIENETKCDVIVHQQMCDDIDSD